MKMLTGLILAMTINLMLFWGQIAVDEINPGASPQFFNYEDSLLSAADAGNYTLNESIADKLPATASSVSPTTGNIFTDPIATMKNWLLESTGLNYVIAWFNAVPNFLKGIGLPVEVSYALGVIWHFVTVALLVLVLLGRGGS